MSIASVPLPTVSTPHRHKTGPVNGHFYSDASTPPPTARFAGARDNVGAEVFTAVYSGVAVLEMTCRGVSVMRRRSDSALNATQILKVAGIQKGNRTKILEREILTGPHEKVQGGYGKYQGTWISFEIGLALCDRHMVRDILGPLLELDTASAPAMHATPTKEQHQASVRRQQHQQNVVGSRPGLGSLGRSGSLHEKQRPQPRGASAVLLASLQSDRSEQYPNRAASVGRRVSDLDPAAFNASRYASVNGLEHNSQQWNGSHAFTNGADLEDHEDRPLRTLDITPLAPLTQNTARDFDHSREMMTNIFLESDHGRIPGVLIDSQDSDLDLDVPIDELGHTALHWASALARLSLVETLVSRGANPSRGNSAGETALMRAVMATNTMDQNCFLEMLNALGPSLATKDSAKRTVLHHIAITAGIKGRSAASRYYLTSLLEWIVKRDRHVTMDFATFGSTLVDAQDRNGDTALNIAARIGNRGLVQSLLEVNADPFLPNRAGIRPVDSGTVDDRVYNTPDGPQGSMPPQQVAWNNPAMVQASGDLASEITGLITSLQKDFEAEMSTKCKAVEAANASLREANATLADLRRQVEQSKQQVAQIDEIGQRIRNTKRAIVTETEEYNESQTGLPPPQFVTKEEDVDADAAFRVDRAQRPAVSEQTLHGRIRAYRQNLKTLEILAVRLNDKSSAMESRCRKLVSLCTKCPADQVDETLPALLAALQSDGDPREFDLNEASRVAGFLKILS